MRAAYVDSSYLLAIRFGEAGATGMARRLEGLDRRISAGLLEAEVLSALTREGVTDGGLLQSVTWAQPSRSLRPEIARVLALGYARGADLWHLACALYVAETPSELPFLTQDLRQRELAAQLGFPTD